MQLRQFLYLASLIKAGHVSERLFFQELARNQWASPEEVRVAQDEALRRLLLHAYDQVPYYRQIIDEVGGREAIASSDPRDVVKNFPLLTKQLIREHWEDIKSRDLASRKWYYNTSGGSTGEPIRLVQDEIFSQWGFAVKNLFDSWTGYSIGMPKVILWGSERDLLVGKETWRIRLGRWLRNEYWLNAFRMTEAHMRAYVEIINKVRPVQILSYVESIYDLSRFVEREGLTVYSPKAIMTSAGTLYPDMRRAIERVFNAPVFNRYGSREVGDIACECSAHEGLHVCPLTHYVEILREDGTPAGPGETGEVVVTSLVNYSMPLIRYRIGDMAAWSERPCSCGRAWPLLKAVVGRVTDIFVTKNRTRVHGEYFTHLVYFRDWIQKFQFIQEDYDFIRLLVVPSCEFEKAKEMVAREHQDLQDKIRIVMGENCRLEIKLVEDIPPSASGKYRYTISKVVTNV